MAMTIMKGTMGRGNQNMFTGLSASGDGVAISVNGTVTETAVYVSWGVGVTAGVVVVETAHDVNYSGTWAVLATLSWSAASKVDVVEMTGAKAALRVRISTAIVGGTVDAFMVGAGEA